MDEDNYRRRRETLLSVMLAAFVLFGLFLVFTILTGGFLLYILAVVAVAGLVGALHYLLWGRALTEKTAWKREEMEAEERAADEGEWLDETRRPRHY
jgi:hypothetical protein